MSKLAITVLTLLLLVLQGQLWVGEGSIAEMITLQDRLDRLNVENERYYRRNSLLAREVIELQQGLETIEEQARQELGMVRRDETFFLTYD